METVANETGSPPQQALWDPKGTPSGVLIEPSGASRAIAAEVDDPYDLVPIRCAPRYTGVADDILVRRSWAPVARKLVKVGRERARLASVRGQRGTDLRAPIQEEIRQIWRNEASGTGMSVEDAAHLLGLTRQAAYNILNKKVGGQGLRGTDPARS